MISTARGVLLRAAALGAATGARSTAGMAALAATSSRRRVVAGLLTGTEMLLDKSPVVPGRTSPPGLAPRVVFGASAAATLARRDGYDPVLPGAVGLVAALVGAVLGQWARSVAADRLGSDLPGALAEDVVAGALAWAGARRTTASR